MAKGILDISKPANRAALGWLGGGLVVVAGGVWAVVTYVWPAHHGGGAEVNCAQNASVASSGNVRGVTINARGASLQAGNCGSAKAP